MATQYVQSHSQACLYYIIGTCNLAIVTDPAFATVTPLL